MKSLPTALDYQNGIGLLPEGHFRISASGIANFLSNTAQWYRENLLGEAGFAGNTSSLNGSIVHYILQRFALTQKITSEDKQEIANYILKHTNRDYADYNPDIDLDYVTSQYKPMSETIVNDYLAQNMPTHVEPFVAHEVLPGIHVGGSIDNLTLSNPKYSGEPTFENLISCSSGTIVDYKTFGNTSGYLPKQEDPMNFKYKLQLLTYAWVLQQRGLTIDRIRLVYVSKNDTNRVGKVKKDGTQSALKDYPSQVSVQNLMLTGEDYQYISNLIHLIAHSVHTWNTQPELRYLLAQDFTLNPKYQI
jgi:hypothetical protein